MTKKDPHSKFGAAPPERATPGTPRERRVAPPPNPRRPRLVPDIHGNELRDLFEFFPDLPRPRRPAGRIPLRRPRLR
ncbi:MAG: hypothetical protein DMF87_14420 [Acidobacteria bacterium]|nr:MAG: hypothetical protein DMF87_14420 [Acidobacteriota bacterium]